MNDLEVLDATNAFSRITERLEAPDMRDARDLDFATDLDRLACFQGEDRGFYFGSYFAAVLVFFQEFFGA